jgi:hypothetical protein
MNVKMEQGRNVYNTFLRLFTVLFERKWVYLQGDSQLAVARIVTWLILPVVICLSQRLSHACLSLNQLNSETANGSLNQSQFT